MRAIRFDEPSGRAEPSGNSHSRAGVRVGAQLSQAAAICMTDVEVLRGRHAVNFPIIPGHEFCGVVDKVGSSLPRHAWLGKRVVADNEICWPHVRPLPPAESGVAARSFGRLVLGRREVTPNMS